MLARKHWKAEAVLSLLMGLFLIFGMGGIAAAALRPRTVPDSTPGRTASVAPGKETVAKASSGFGAFVVSTLTFHGALLVLIWHFVRQHRVGWTQAFGWNRRHFPKAVAAGITASGIAVPGIYGLHWLSAAALEFLGKPWGYHPSAQGTVEMLLNSGSWLQSAYIFIFATAIAPLAEELLFRGILFPFIRDLGYPRMALGGTAVLFGAMHGNLAALVPLIALGAILAVLYQQTGNLLASVVAHSLFNLVPFILMACGFQVPE